MSIAFYDFDKTVIHGDAGPLLGLHLFERRRRRIDEKHATGAAAARKMALWTALLPYATWMSMQAALYKGRAIRRSTIVRSAYKGFKGVPVQVLDDVLDDFVASDVQPRIYPEIIADMQAHAEAGRSCVIITTGMQKLVERVLPYLPKGTQAIGCTLEEKDGRLTGRIVHGPLYGADKANIALAYCQARGVDPSTCYGYSDHFSDHQLLDAVGHGVCINPARRLTKMAGQRGWKVLRPGDPRA